MDGRSSDRAAGLSTDELRAQCRQFCLQLLAIASELPINPSKYQLLCYGVANLDQTLDSSTPEQIEDSLSWLIAVAFQRTMVASESESRLISWAVDALCGDDQHEGFLQLAELIIPSSVARALVDLDQEGKSKEIQEGVLARIQPMQQPAHFSPWDANSLFQWALERELFQEPTPELSILLAMQITLDDLENRDKTTESAKYLALKQAMQQFVDSPSESEAKLAAAAEFLRIASIHRDARVHIPTWTKAEAAAVFERVLSHGAKALIQSAPTNVPVNNEGVLHAVVVAMRTAIAAIPNPAKQEALEKRCDEFSSATSELEREERLRDFCHTLKHLQPAMGFGFFQRTSVTIFEKALSTAAKEWIDQVMEKPVNAQNPSVR